MDTKKPQALHAGEPHKQHVKSLCIETLSQEDDCSGSLAESGQEDIR